jgi:hypothetical protein
MTISQMITELRRRARDFVEQASSIQTATEDKRRFHLARRLIVPYSLTVYYKDAIVGWTLVAASNYVMDYDSGWCAFALGYDVNNGDQFRFDFATTKRFSDAMVYSWMNAAVNALWPQIYVLASEEVAVSASVHEYAIPEGAYNVTALDTRRSASSAWASNHAWRLTADETKVHFYRHPGTCSARMTFITKPKGILTIEDELDEFVEITGLPLETEEAVLLYCEYCIARATETERIGNNVSINYEPSAAMKVGDLSQVVKDLYAAFITYKESIEMPPYEMNMRVPL